MTAGGDLRFGCVIVPRDPDLTRECAAAAERAGLQWFGIADSPVLFGETYVHQAEAARATTRIRISAVVSHLTLRHPVVIAAALSTLQQISNDRAMGVLATGNSAARGLGLAPTRLADLAAGAQAIRDHWAGRAATYGNSTIPATGRPRRDAPLFIAGDGPRAVDVAGRAGDGVLYSGTLDPAVVARRARQAREGGPGGTEFWIATVPSLQATEDRARAEVGQVIAGTMNRALRGDLVEREVPAALHGEVERIRRRYAYGDHSAQDSSVNADLLSDELFRYLLEHFAIHGDESRWGGQLHAIASAGVNGVLFIINQPQEVDVIEAIGSRLKGLGHLQQSAVA